MGSPRGVPRRSRRRRRCGPASGAVAVVQSLPSTLCATTESSSTDNGAATSPQPDSSCVTGHWAKGSQCCPRCCGTTLLPYGERRLQETVTVRARCAGRGRPMQSDGQDPLLAEAPSSGLWSSADVGSGRGRVERRCCYLPATEPWQTDQTGGHSQDPVPVPSRPGGQGRTGWTDGMRLRIRRLGVRVPPSAQHKS